MSNNQKTWGQINSLVKQYHKDLQTILVLNTLNSQISSTSQKIDEIIQMIRNSQEPQQQNLKEKAIGLITSTIKAFKNDFDCVIALFKETLIPKISGFSSYAETETKALQNKIIDIEIHQHTTKGTQNIRTEIQSIEELRPFADLALKGMTQFTSVYDGINLSELGPTEDTPIFILEANLGALKENLNQLIWQKPLENLEDSSPYFISSTEKVINFYLATELEKLKVMPGPWRWNLNLDITCIKPSTGVIKELGDIVRKVITKGLAAAADTGLSDIAGPEVGYVAAKAITFASTANKKKIDDAIQHKLIENGVVKYLDDHDRNADDFYMKNSSAIGNGPWSSDSPYEMNPKSKVSLKASNLNRFSHVSFSAYDYDKWSSDDLLFAYKVDMRKLYEEFVKKGLLNKQNSQIVHIALAGDEDQGSIYRLDMTWTLTAKGDLPPGSL